MHISLVLMVNACGFHFSFTMNSTISPHMNRLVTAMEMMCSFSGKNHHLRHVKARTTWFLVSLSALNNIQIKMNNWNSTNLWQPILLFDVHDPVKLQSSRSWEDYSSSTRRLSRYTYVITFYLQSKTLCWRWRPSLWCWLVRTAPVLLAAPKFVPRSRKLVKNRAPIILTVVSLQR
jgi:hypothetical protein